MIVYFHRGLCQFALVLIHKNWHRSLSSGQSDADPRLLDSSVSVSKRKNRSKPCAMWCCVWNEITIDNANNYQRYNQFLVALLISLVL
jgi:hypothetical protein